MKEQAIFPQRKFFKALQFLLNGEENIIQWLAETLDVDYNISYRRVNGQTKLSLDEMMQILKAYPEASSLVMEVFPISKLSMVEMNIFRNEEDFQSYLSRTIQLFKTLKEQEGVHLYYIARDLTLFHFLANSALLEYKYSYWTNQLKESGIVSLSPETHLLAKKLYQLYLAIPSTEIWKSSVIAKQHYLLKEALEEQTISPSQVETIKCALVQIVNRTKEWCTKSMKNEGIDFHLHNCNSVTMNNGGIIEFGNSKVLFGSWTNVQFFKSTNPVLIDIYLKDWEKHLSHSKPISQTIGFFQDAFFKAL